MDVLLLPTAGTIYTKDAVEADPIQLNTNLGYYTNFVNLMDLAAVAVPAGFRRDGLPFGVSLIGPAFSDAALLALASRFARATAEPPATVEAPGCIHVAVVGAHLTGQPLNHQLTERGARLVQSCRTSPGLPPLRARRHHAAQARARARAGLRGSRDRGGGLGRAAKITSAASSPACRRRSASAACSSTPASG